MSRRTQLAIIHIAKKELGLSEPEYRALLARMGVRSAAELDEAGRMRLIEEMKRRGFRPRKAGRPTPSADRAPLIAKVDALLIELGGLPRRYADGIAQRMFGRARVEWCKPDELRKIVAALEYQKRRRCSKS